jgi:hypothetical protein
MLPQPRRTDLVVARLGLELLGVLLGGEDVAEPAAVLHVGGIAGDPRPATSSTG